jgi:hypothetical protein
VSACFRLEESVELVDLLIRKRRIQRNAHYLRQRPASVPLCSRHCYRGCVKRARWWVDRTKLVPTTYRPGVWTTADQVRPVLLEAHSSTSAIASGSAIQTEAETVREIFQRFLKLVAQPSSSKMITITGTGGDKTHTSTITLSVSIFPIDFAECTYPEPKPGRIG